MNKAGSKRQKVTAFNNYTIPFCQDEVKKIFSKKRNNELKLN